MLQILWRLQGLQRVQSFSERRSFERRSRFEKWALNWTPLIISPLSASWALLTILWARDLVSGANLSAELSAAHILQMSAELSAAHFLVSALMLWKDLMSMENLKQLLEGSRVNYSTSDA